MKCFMAKFVLWLLLLEQKEHHTAVVNNLIQTTNKEPDFLKKVITRDDVCVYLYSYDPEMKAQSSQWQSPGPPRRKKVGQSHSKIKTMLTVFFDWEGVVHHEYAPPGQTINEYGLSVLHQKRCDASKIALATGNW